MWRKNGMSTSCASAPTLSLRFFNTERISSAFVTIHKAMLREIKVYTEQRPSDRRYVLIQFAGFNIEV